MPDVFIRGSGYVDAFTAGRNANGEVYYKTSDSSGIVGSSPESSTYQNFAQWSNHNYSIQVPIPKTIGGYEVTGIEYVKKLSINEDLDYLGGNYVERQDIMNSLYDTSLEPKQNSPFNVSGNGAILINGVDSGGNGYVNDGNKWWNAVMSPFNNTSRDYTLDYAFNESSRILNLDISASWTIIGNLANESGAPMTFGDEMARLVDSRLDIINGVIRDNGITGSDIANYFGVSEEEYNSNSDKYQAEFVIAHPDLTYDPSIGSGGDYEDHETDRYGESHYSSEGYPRSYAEWRSSMASLLIPGGLPGHEGDADYTWNSLFDGTYWEKLGDNSNNYDDPDGSVGNNDHSNVRCYQPYIIKLQVKKIIDLELTSDCDAKVDNNAILVKAVGNAIELPAGETSVDETIKITIKNNTFPEVNCYQGMISAQALQKGSPVDYFGAGSGVSTIASTLRGAPGASGSYMSFPVEPREVDQMVTISMYINSDKTPKEGNWDNNPWETTVIIPAQKPDLIASGVTYTVTGNKIGSSATVNLKLATADKDFDLVPSIAAATPNSKVTAKVWVDGVLTKSEDYLHPIPVGDFYQTTTFNTGVFTTDKIAYYCEVELEINPNKNQPTSEATFTNNKIRTQFVIVVEPDELPPPDGVDPPKFTNVDGCITVSGSNPSTDSATLFTMGTFEMAHKVDLPSGYPTSSEINWVKLKDRDLSTDPIPDRLNAGVPNVRYDAAFPGKGRDGWITITDPDAEGCNYCKYDTDRSIYNFYQQFMSEYQCAATFAAYDITGFQESESEEVIDTGTVKYLRFNTRTVTNAQPCYGNCCKASTQRNAMTYVARDIHGHHSHDHPYSTTDAAGAPVTRQCENKVCEIAPYSCYGECDHNGTKYSRCHTEYSPGIEYSNANPVHYHSHTEVRLEYAAAVNLTFNVKLYDASTKAVDYMTGDRVTRAGYGIATPISNLRYATDYATSYLNASEKDFGDFKVKTVPYCAYVRTPATNKPAPYLVTKLQAANMIAPFPTKYDNIPNPKSVMKSRLIFTDIDYPDTDNFPVLYSLVFDVQNFKPGNISYLSAAEQGNYNNYVATGKTKAKLGLCLSNSIAIRGNAWNDSWTHVDNNETKLN